jgi:hypothetical protein
MLAMGLKIRNLALEHLAQGLVGGLALRWQGTV